MELQKIDMAEPDDAVGASPEGRDAATERPAAILVICSYALQPFSKHVSHPPLGHAVHVDATQCIRKRGNDWSNMVKMIRFIPWPWVAWSASSCSRLKCRRSPCHSFLHQETYTKQQESIST